MKTNDTAKSLLELAQEKFSPLSAAEEKLLLAVPQGEIADCTLGGNDNPAVLFEDDKVNSWGEDRHIRAALLRWLVVAPEARPHIDPLGIQVHGAAIAGRLDLAHANLPFPLAFNRCHFAEEPAFSFGRFRLLCFAGSASAGLDFTAVHIDTRLDLIQFHCHGELLLLDAHINGPLNAGGAHLEAPNGKALTADRIVITGDCYLRNGFSSQGEVRLLGAEIGGNLSCIKGDFSNEMDDALNAEHVRIGNGLALDSMKAVRGRFNFSRAEIGSLIFRKFPAQTDNFMLDLRQAHCAALFDDPAAWEVCTNYVLAGFHYDSLDNCSAPIVKRLDWLRRADNGGYSPQPYEQLAKTLRAAGHPDDARDVLIEKEKRKPESWRRDTPMQRFMYYPRQALHWLHWLLVRYGYRPTVALTWVLALWVFGAVVFFVAEQRGAFFPAKDRVYVEAAQKCVVSEAAKRQGISQGWLTLFGAKEPPPCFAMPNAYPRLNVAMYSLDALVPFLDLHQEEYWLPDESKFVGQIATWYLWCHIIFGWLLATFGLAAITGLAKRE